MMNFEKLYLNDEQIAHIHSQTLEVLDKKGIQFEHETALELFRAKGFRVEGDMVFFSQKQIEDALATCPKTFQWASLEGEMEVGQNMNTCFGSSAGPPFVMRDGVVREGTLKDYIDIAKLVETSDVMNFSHLLMTDASDIVVADRPYVEMAALLKYTTKPINITALQTDKESVRQVAVNEIQMIKDYYGKSENIAIGGVCVTSPLCYSQTDVDVILGYVEGGQPVMVMTCTMPVMTAPGVFTSAIIQNNSEVLAGIVFTQLVNPGNPIIYANTSTSTNLMKMSLVLGCAETALISVCTAALAKFYGLPFRTGGSLSDAIDVDYQAGIESAYCASAAIYADVDIMQFSCGLFGSFNISSLEKYVLDEQNIKMALRMRQGVNCEVGQDYISQILAMKPRGSYIYNGTPPQYRQEFTTSAILNKEGYNAWQLNNGKSLLENATIAVDKRLESYVGRTLTKEQETFVGKYLPSGY